MHVVDYEMETFGFAKKLNFIYFQVIDKLKSLSYLPGFISMHDVSYFDFLNRVQVEENKLRSLGLWEVPHPWLNLYVPKSRILDFHNGVIKDILLSQKSASGLALLYPTNRNKYVFMIYSYLSSRTSK